MHIFFNNINNLNTHTHKINVKFHNIKPRGNLQFIFVYLIFIISMLKVVLFCFVFSCCCYIAYDFQLDEGGIILITIFNR